jgi:hypothetical protein
MSYRDRVCGCQKRGFCGVFAMTDISLGRRPSEGGLFTSAGSGINHNCTGKRLLLNNTSFSGACFGQLGPVKLWFFAVVVTCII